jgi:lipopolysaccharide-induced tumor necrosis factor-alpha factor
MVSRSIDRSNRYPNDSSRFLLEQATMPYAPAPPVTTVYSMYSTSGMVMQPQGPPGGSYTTTSSAMPYQTFPTGSSLVITTQSKIFGDVPLQCTCPNCHHTIVTRIEKSSGALPWLICCVIFFFVGALGCCLIPFCIDGLKVSVDLLDVDRTN